MIFLVHKFNISFSKCQLESQPGQLLQSLMPKFQSWSILGTHLLSSYLGTAYSPMLNLQSCPMVIYSLACSLVFLRLLWSSFPVYPTVLYSKIWLHVAFGSSIHIYSYLSPIFITPSISNII